MPYPDTDFAKVYAANEKPSSNIRQSKAELERWEKRWRDTDEFVPWPPCATTSREFVRIWREAFRPLRDWVNACALCVAAEVQRDYREFRLERGLVKYADQMSLAGELMRLPDVVRRIRENNYRVILDEAQDTDPQQFFVSVGGRALHGGNRRLDGRSSRISRTATRPFLHGRRLPAINLSRPCRPRSLPRAARSARRYGRARRN